MLVFAEGGLIASKAAQNVHLAGDRGQRVLVIPLMFSTFGKFAKENLNRKLLKDENALQLEKHLDSGFFTDESVRDSRNTGAHDAIHLYFALRVVDGCQDGDVEFIGLRDNYREAFAYAYQNLTWEEAAALVE